MTYRSLRPARMAVAVLLAMLVVSTVAGCNEVAHDTHEHFAQSLSHGQRTASIDFASDVSGRWDRMIIVCRGTTANQLNESLGFDWEDAPDLNDPGFLSTMLFVRGDEVESSWNAGSDSDWEFIPCPLGTNDEADLPSILSIPRDHSVVRFEFDDSNPNHHLWFVTSDEFLQLAASTN